ncbi:MAG: NAAT family transporter [Simkaniaceae bacterium]|nr:NAAT family transporter [Simkaniaceae bacterium]
MISSGATPNTALSLAISMFLLMDPIGNVPMFLATLKDLSPSRQRRVIFRELVIALIVIILFAFVGEYLLKILDISQPSLLISGGIILFLIALKMIFPPDKETTGAIQKEPFIVPLAIPLIAGPSVLAAVMVYSRHLQQGWVLYISIFMAWVVTAIVLLAASNLKKALGERGLIACERLMGLILTLISVQMFLEGVALIQK